MSGTVRTEVLMILIAVMMKMMLMNLLLILLQTPEHIQSAVWLSSVMVVNVVAYDRCRCRRHRQFALRSSVITAGSRCHRHWRWPVHLWYDSATHCFIML